MSIKGYPSQEKSLGQVLNYTPAQSQTSDQFVTVQNIDTRKHGMDVVSHSAYTLATGKVSAAGSTVRVIKCASHGARLGDFIKFTSGTNIGLEAPVLTVVDSGTLILACSLLAIPATIDTFNVMRYITPVVDSAGAITAVLTGANLEATQQLVLTQLQLIAAGTGALNSLGYAYIDFSVTALTGGVFTDIFTVPALKTAYRARIVQNGGNDFKFNLNGGAALGAIPAGEKGDIDIILAAGQKFAIDSISGGNITSGKLFINFFGV